MESKRKLERIRCVFLVKEIFNYIKDKNYKFKLFKYSKSFQKKFDIDLIDYQEQYINKLGINFGDYLTLKYDENENFIKDILTIRLNYNLMMNNVHLYMKNIQKIAVRYFRKIIKYNEENKESSENKKLYQIIDIYSPFFDAISKSEIFDYFIIEISMNKIVKLNSKNDYISIFNKMNKLKSKYSSIRFAFQDNNDINDLKDFNINFGQINNLIIFYEYGYDFFIDYNNFLKTLFI